MNELKEIYPFFWPEGYHNPFIFEISVDTTYDDFKKEKEQSDGFPTFMHEFTHYLQNFSTPLGIQNFLEYQQVSLLLFNKIALLNTNPSLPLKACDFVDDFGHKNINNYFEYIRMGMNYDSVAKKYVFEDYQFSDYQLITKTVRNSFYDKDVDLLFITYHNKIVPITFLTIKENMSRIASYLAAGTPVNNIDATIYKYDMEYHIIYGFIKSILKDKDCARLTFQICEMSLLVMPYLTTINSILTTIKANEKLLINKSEDEIIDYLLDKIHFTGLSKEDAINSFYQTYGYRLNLSKEYVIELFNKTKYFENSTSLRNSIISAIRSTKLLVNDYVRILSGIYNKHDVEIIEFVIRLFTEVCIKGLDLRLKNWSFYKNKFDYDYLKYYLSHLNSPMLVFKNSPKMLFGGQLNDKYLDLIAYYTSIQRIFFDCYYYDQHKCPFYDDKELCKFPRKNECSFGYKDIIGKQEFRTCLAYNGLITVGVRREERIN